MKRIVKSFAIAAVSALAFISCSQEQNPVSQENGIHFTIRTSENPQVKSFIESDFEGRYIPKWSKGDELAMFVGAIAKDTKPTGVLTNLNNDGELAKFDGKVTGIEETGTFKSFAPASAFATSYNSGNIGITLAEVQKPSSLTIDEACDILVAKETSYMADATGEVTIDNLFFKRIFSVVKVTLKGPASLKGQNVSKFSLTAPEGTVLTGRAAINLTTATIDKWNISNNSVTATYSEDAPMFGGEAGLENEVWLVVNPGIIESGAKVVFAGETANYTFSKEVTLTKALTFPESQLAVINLTLKEENCTVKEASAPASWVATDLADITATDEVVITMAKDGAVYALTSEKGSSAAPTAVAVTVKNKELTAAPADALVWNIANDKGNLTIYPKGQTATWLYTTTSNNGVRVGTNDNKTFVVDSETKYLKNTTTNRYLGVYNNADWRCYTSTSTNIGSQTLCFYVKGDPIDNTIPTLSVDQTEKTWAADAKDAFVVKVTVNSEGGDWNVTPETLSWATIAVDKTAGTITVTPNGANKTKTANEATLTVTHASDASLTKEISLKQNGVGDAALTEKTATIQFGTDNVKIDQASVTANDNQKNSWTITTVGTTSFNPYPLYYQVGSKNSAAKSITFTTTLPEDAEVTSISAKFGGNTSTAGTITLKVGETIVGTGTLNGKNDVTVTSTSTAAGNKVTITVTNIAKGVKCYNIQVKYKTAN